MSPIGRSIGTWLTLSLPILDVHVALAGYADLAMAAYLTLATLAALALSRRRARARTSRWHWPCARHAS